MWHILDIAMADNTALPFGHHQKCMPTEVKRASLQHRLGMGGLHGALIARASGCILAFRSIHMPFAADRAIRNAASELEAY